MARTRTVKPEFWDDEKLARISRDSRLTFIGIWTVSDDYGVCKGNTSYLKNKIFPYDEIGHEEFERWLAELQDIGAINPFVYHNEKFFHIKNFHKHQKIDHPSKTRNPEPPRETIAKYSRDNRFETETETETETEYKQKTTLSGKQEAACPTTHADLDKFAFMEQGVATEEDVASITGPPNGSDPSRTDTVHKKGTYKGRIIEIVDYLNQKVGASYKHDTEDTVKLITARLKQGFTVEDFRTVIDKKTAKWKGDPKMQAFLRPPTLFSTKFESYLNEPEGGLNGHTRGGKPPLAFEAEKPRGKYADVEKFVYTDHWPVAREV